jgi:hypothetical protein
MRFVKRYRVDFSYGRYYFEEREDGDWVRFEDHSTEIERLKAHMRKVAGGLNNRGDPIHAAAELLLVAGLPPPQS